MSRWPDDDNNPDFYEVAAGIIAALILILVLTSCGSGSSGGSIAPPPDPTPPAPALTACWDGLDNDSDGLVDYGNDPGCDSPSDDDETNAPAPPPVECGTGLAAVDLSGTCRANPPTPGALEAVQ